jgi:Uma2 family endonuclease
MSSLSIEEYLHTSYENPDPEYKDGELVERSFADNAHSTAMGRVSNIFWDLRESRPFHGRISMRCRVAATRIRVPDVCVYAGDEPTESVPSHPPLVAVEIVSDDRYSETMQKLEDYDRWGVRYMWLVVPPLQKLYAYGAGTLSEVPTFEIPEYDVRITAADIFG